MKKVNMACTVTGNTDCTLFHFMYTFWTKFTFLYKMEFLEYIHLWWTDLHPGYLGISTLVDNTHNDFLRQTLIINGGYQTLTCSALGILVQLY